jgi:hypothetical protein
LPSRRARELDREPPALELSFAPGELGPRAGGLRLLRREAPARRSEAKGRLLLETWVGEQPAVVVEEADHRGVLLHALEVPCELLAEIGRGAGVRRNGCRAENEGAQARDEGFQD